MGGGGCAEVHFHGKQNEKKDPNKIGKKRNSLIQKSLRAPVGLRFHSDVGVEMIAMLVYISEVWWGLKVTKQVETTYKRKAVLECSH